MRSLSLLFDGLAAAGADFLFECAGEYFVAIGALPERRRAAEWAAVSF